MKDSPMKKAGILGGTFDPVTLGHLSLAQNIQQTIKLHEVWFIPAWRSPHKQDRPVTDAHHRLNMLKEILAPFPDFKISTIELDKKEVSYTINTLTGLQSQHPDTEWYLILGMDTFQEFSTWKNVRKILESVHLTVASRPGYPNDFVPENLKTLLGGLPYMYELSKQTNEAQTYLCPETRKTLVFCDIEPIDISSSEIRERIRAGLSVKKMLPPEVERYIMAHRLYQANSPTVT